MNKSQKKFVRQVNEAIERFKETRYSSRGGLLPTLTHGAITPPRSKVKVSAGRINLDDYEDLS